MTRARPGAVTLAVAAFLLIATRQAYTVRFTGLGLSAAQLILFVLAALWVVTRLTGQRDANRVGVLSALPLVLLGVALVSYALSHRGLLTADQLTDSDHALERLVLAVGVVVVVPALVRRPADLELVLRALAAGGALSALFALVRFATGLDVAASLYLPGLTEGAGSTAEVVLLRGGLERPQGAAATPLELGGVLTMLVPVALGLFFAARRRGGRAWPWAAVAAVTAAGGAVTLSRSVFVGLAVALLVMAPRWPVRRAAGTVAAVAALVVVAALAAGGFVSTVADLLVHGSNDYSLASRADGRSYVWTTFAQHFWLGQGPGTYDLGTQPVLDNEYLSQLMETGVLGLLALVAVLGVALAYALAAAGRRWAGRDTAELANGLAGAVAALIVISTILDVSAFVQISTLLWLLVGLVAASWRITADRPATVTPPALTPAAAPVR